MLTSGSSKKVCQSFCLRSRYQLSVLVSKPQNPHLKTTFKSAAWPDTRTTILGLDILDLDILVDSIPPEHHTILNSELHLRLVRKLLSGTYRWLLCIRTQYHQSYVQQPGTAQTPYGQYPQQAQAASAYTYPTTAVILNYRFTHVYSITNNILQQPHIYHGGQAGPPAPGYRE